MTKITYRTVGVDGMKIFYREAGPTNAPTLLLLHGFPTSSHMFRNLIPLLADRFHIVAPDLPGFGQSDLPSRDAFTYTFARLAEVIGRFTEVVKLKVTGGIPSRLIGANLPRRTARRCGASSHRKRRSGNTRTASAIHRWCRQMAIRSTIST